METITYTPPDYKSKPMVSDNASEVHTFIGEQPPCPVCGGSGEYESEYGPKGCNPCNSRLIAFVDHTGKTVYADWGDSIEKREDGLRLIPFVIPM